MKSFRALVVIALLRPCVAFVSQGRRPASQHTLQRTAVDDSLSAVQTFSRDLTLHAKRSPTGDFELQELKAQIESLNRQGIPSSLLPPTKRFELESYTRAIVENKYSPVPLEQVWQKLPGTKWRLSFSTENAALSNLPKDATVVLNFLDDNQVDYTLRFGERTAGLNSITAKSTWTAGQGNNVSRNNPGLVTMVYDKITCDAFGLANLGIGFFGMLKGRSSFIQTVYFDNDIWIDGGYAADGSTYFSVYTPDGNP